MNETIELKTIDNHNFDAFIINLKYTNGKFNHSHK